MKQKIAALFVDTKGVYSNLPFVDVWDHKRDARLYDGPWPVVAHPPCARWCRLAGLVNARWGYAVGDDQGCFEAALGAVRAFGGVLEHPAYSKAFYQFGLPIPVAGGGWQRGLCGGWVAYVEQYHYGHQAKKATWLYAVTNNPPSLRWSATPDRLAPALVSWCGNKVQHTTERKRISKRAASSTPLPFRNVLIDIALNSESIGGQ